MCKCTPIIRTPFCGKTGCEWKEKPKNARDLAYKIPECKNDEHVWGDDYKEIDGRKTVTRVCAICGLSAYTYMMFNF